MRVRRMHDNQIVSMLRIYLAGPDVFRPEAAEHGRRLLALCAEFGFEGIFPLDQSLPPGLPPRAAADRIYRANIAHLDACDAVIANLDFFRGAEPDSGTCFEVGYAIARGKPVVAYVPEEGTFAQRIVRRQPDALRDHERDSNGWEVEEFGLPLNLMLGVSCRVVTGGPREALAALRLTQG